MELQRKEAAHSEELVSKQNKYDEEIKLAEVKYSDYESRISKLEKQLETSNNTVISQTDSEKLWERTMCQKNFGVASSDTSMFKPHSPQISSQGPQSLPSELVSEAHKEVRRLQELRRYIQEECDQLLLRKERLREEVVWHAEHNYHQSSGLLSTHSNSISNNYGQMDVWQLNSRKLESQVTCMQNCPSSL